MNWANFQTYNDAPTKAFEILCNQLFENWCTEQYSSELASFHVVNGSGGDGGVESYAVLSDGSIIGLQAKWFPDSITANQMGQIKNSINTALKLRPQISRYIVCIPRDLASLTGKGENTEDKRWEDMKSDVLKDHPNLTLDLWNETRLTHELQKECSSGIFKFWFERAEISEESIQFSFEKSKNSWLTTKYVPELNTYGMIHSFVSTYLGDVDEHREINKVFSHMNDLCNSFHTIATELVESCGENAPQLVILINETKSQIQTMQREISIIQSWLDNESIVGLNFDEEAFWIDFSGIAARVKHSKEEPSHYLHCADVIKVLQSLGKIRIIPILNQIKRSLERRTLVFLGEPGTGKTHGIAAEADRLLKDHYHFPILIQARDISATATWKDILISCLGLASSWSEEEIWQGLSSLANRRKFHILDDCDNVSVLPKILIVVDGVDESSLHDKWIERVQEANTIIQSYPSIRFCFMSRPYIFADKNTGARIINVDVNGDVPTYKLFDSYVKAYNIDVSSAGWIKYALSTPLALKLFCELNQGNSISFHSGTDVSIAALLKEKIKVMEIEYCKLDSSATVADQNVFRSILLLANSFGAESRIERSKIIASIARLLSVDT